MLHLQEWDMGWVCHISRKNNMVRKSSLRIFIKRAKWALFVAHSLFGQMNSIWKISSTTFRRSQKKKFQKVEKFFFVKEAFSKTGFLCKSKNNGRWGGGRVWRRHFSSTYWNAPDLCPCEIPSQHFYFSMLTWWWNQSPKRKCSKIKLISLAHIRMCMNVLQFWKDFDVVFKKTPCPHFTFNCSLSTYKWEMSL